jgi:hypothetical protein
MTAACNKTAAGHPADVVHEMQRPEVKEPDTQENSHKVQENPPQEVILE